MADEDEIKFIHAVPGDLARRLEAFLASERKRLAPATLPRRSVINEALRLFLDKQEAADEAEPDRTLALVS